MKSIWALMICMSLLLTGMSWADIPAPPVNQDIGMPDVAIENLTEAECRVCHSSGVQDRHHLLYDQPIVDDSRIPFPDTDGDGVADPNYRCLSCHDREFTVVRDCIACHTVTPHHTTAPAKNRDCVSCHGDLVDNYDDGHYIPTYSPSLVTPKPSDGEGLPLNSRSNGAGACDYCHDNDGQSPTVILTNRELHHSIGGSCSWCHDFSQPSDQKVRACESCHGPDSIHSIQADSPKEPNGTIVVGGEFAGYGHVGRDAGPADSDCWGCHGFSAAAEAPTSGLLVPTVYSAHRTVVEAGTDTLIVLSGSAFTNIAGEAQYEAKAVLTAADGSSVVLTPDEIEEKLLSVTIPADTQTGNYNLQAVKTDANGKQVASNPTVISVVPRVMIHAVTSDGIVTITGSGFGGYVAGSDVSVTGKITTLEEDQEVTTTVAAKIVSWSDTVIKAEFTGSPQEVTVNSVFGNDTAKISGN